MSGRHYDPEALESLGRFTCGFLAEDYQEFVRQASVAGSHRDEAFTSVISGTWDTNFTIFYNCVYETAANIQAFGGALLDIVARNLEDEAAIETAMSDAQDAVYEDGYTRVEDHEGEDGTLEQASDSTTLDDNPYEDQLAGTDPNAPEPQ